MLFDLKTNIVLFVMASSSPIDLVRLERIAAMAITTNSTILVFSVRSHLVSAFNAQNLVPPSISNADHLGKYVAAQKDRAYPGHEAAFRPKSPMYQLLQAPANTLLRSSLWTFCVSRSSADCFTSMTRALLSKTGAKSDLMAKST